jgi:hypothetical protein
MIFDTAPTDWKNLQQKVHQAFIEMGCHAEEPKTISLVRGQKEVDVYVEDIVHGIKSVYLIECKYWNSDIPQDVIHGFRTVVSDSGANKGIIIAKKGFQSGASEANFMTPVELMTWDQFNSAFFDKWIAATSDSLQKRARKLIEFRAFPYGSMCDSQQVKLTQAEHDLWWKYINEFTETAILGARDILKELNNGSVQLLKPGTQVTDITSVQPWNIKTHREWYNYISPKLDEWCEKTETWMKSFRIRTQAP